MGTRQENSEQGVPAPEVKQVEVRLYRIGTREDPTLALVDGLVYRLERNQDEMRCFLEVEDIRAELKPMLTPEAEKLVTALDEALFNEAMVRLQTLEKELIELLPAHAKAIAHAFEPDNEEKRLSSAEWIEHHYCTLGEAPTEGFTHHATHPPAKTGRIGRA